MKNWFLHFSVKKTIARRKRIRENGKWFLCRKVFSDVNNIGDRVDTTRYICLCVRVWLCVLVEDKPDVFTLRLTEQIECRRIGQNNDALHIYVVACVSVLWCTSCTHSTTSISTMSEPINSTFGWMSLCSSILCNVKWNDELGKVLVSGAVEHPVISFRLDVANRCEAKSIDMKTTVLEWSFLCLIRFHQQTAMTTTSNKIENMIKMRNFGKCVIERTNTEHLKFSTHVK